jgi:hypothetical protein
MVSPTAVFFVPSGLTVENTARKAEVDGDAIGERAAPGHLDAAALADRAAGAVGGDQVVGADGLGGAAVPGAQDRRDPVVVLLEGDQVGGVGVLGAALLGRPAQQWLSPIWVMNSRDVGLNASTPSLKFRKNNFNSGPPRLSTATMAPFCTNSRADADSISPCSPTLQQRRRQPHEAASHDQHGHLAVAHRAVPSRAVVRGRDR